MQTNTVQRETPTSTPTTETSGERSTSGAMASSLRGMSFDAGAAYLSPAGGGEPAGGAPVQRMASDAPVQRDGEGTTGATTPATTTTATPTPGTPTPAPAPTDAPAPAPTLPTLPAGVAELPVTDVIRLTYADLLTYCQTRPASHLDTLRHDGTFVDRCASFSIAQMADLVLAMILRTPDQVVDKAGATAEAMRILRSQLQNKEIMKNLLRNDVRVVIVPRTMLMTDLPEFATQQNTFTFDGRPWDTTRGLGGQSTAIAEENLMGTDVDDSNSRLGWDSQASMDAARATDATAMPVAGGAGVTSFNPGVYCSGYSTTNHEFFHTIHMYGLAPADSALIQSEYDAKKTKVPTAPAPAPTTTPAPTDATATPTATPTPAAPLTANDEPWADGIRRMEDGTPADNYSSSTVYEYFAQTGCAYQGTNAGTDPYTGRARNNGQGWVSAHDPGLGGLLGRVCSHTELQGVNPRDQRAQEAAAAAAAVGASVIAAVTAAVSGVVDAVTGGGGDAPAPTPTSTAPTPAPTPTPTTPEPPTVGTVAPPGAAVGTGAVGVITPR